MVAILGGFLARKGDGEPGTQTLWLGLQMLDDITERKLAEVRIGEVMRQQHAIIDNIPSSAWLKDREGRYVAVNEPFCRSLGLAPEDLIGKGVYDIYPLELAKEYEQSFNEIMASGTRTYIEESLVDGRGGFSKWRRSKPPFSTTPE